MILRHLHIPGTIHYTRASRIQDKLVAKFLAHKANSSTNPAPEPTIITTQFYPVYTCGRRDIGAVSEQQNDYLTAPTDHGRAEFHEAPRGGQTTFHGPGQLVAYPILDLKKHGLTPRNYVCLLEQSVIRCCEAEFGIHTMTTENPGIWTDEIHKLCALGVHLRRNVSSHGIALNVSTELAWFDRIVACGLEGKKTTNLEREGAPGWSVEQVGEIFVEQMTKDLKGVNEVVHIAEDEVD